MRKFRDNSGIQKKENKKTVFTKFMDSNNKLSDAPIQPDAYDIVEYIGTNNYNHFFRAKDKDSSSWGFFIGELGDEFK